MCFSLVFPACQETGKSSIPETELDFNTAFYVFFLSFSFQPFIYSAIYFYKKKKNVKKNLIVSQF